MLKWFRKFFDFPSVQPRLHDCECRRAVEERLKNDPQFKNDVEINADRCQIGVTPTPENFRKGMEVLTARNDRVLNDGVHMELHNRHDAVICKAEWKGFWYGATLGLTVIIAGAAAYANAKKNGGGPKNPLDQFEVLAVSFLGKIGYTNLAVTLTLSFLTLAFLLTFYDRRLRNNYDFILFETRQLVSAMVKENLVMIKQMFFTIIYYLFIFILACNLIGLASYAFTPTSSFALTFFVANTCFTGLNHVGLIQYGWEMMCLFLPPGAPLAITPFLVIIEAVSYIARVFSLSVRLFANMMSGHALLKILIGFSWAMLTAGGIMVFIALLPWIIVTAIMYLELLIAFLQSYVFTILITLYINDIVNFGH